MTDKPKHIKALKLTDDELKKVEWAKAKHADLKDKGETVYFNLQNGIDKSLKSLTKTDYYELSTFYKPELVPQALAKLKVADKVSYQTAEGKTLYVDQKAIKQRLTDNVDKLEAFYNKHLQGYLAESTRYFTLRTKDGKSYRKEIDELAKYFTEVDPTIIKDNKGGTLHIKEGYTVSDQNALNSAIKQLGLPTYKDTEITPEPSGTTDMSTFFNSMLDIVGLARDTEITPESGAVMQAGGLAINQEHLQLNRIVNDVLAGVKDLAKAQPIGGKSRSVVNIKDPESHRYIGRPSTTSFIDMVEGAVNGRDLKNLGKIYRNKDEREQEGGFLAHIDNPQEALPFIFDDTDQQLKAKFMANSVALAVDAVTALQSYKRENPDNTGYIKIKDLAMYIKRYADDIATKGSLRPQYRKAIMNGLTIAQLMGANYVVDKNKKTGLTKWHKVYLIDRITDYETNKKGDVVAVRTDFTTEYKASLTYNLGVVLDGVQNLKTPEIKLLATYISDRQVAKQNDTIEGKPITFTADTLCSKAGITDQHTTNRYNTLAKMLNELQTEGVAVGKWATKAKGNTITGFNKESQTIYIHPTKNVQQAYTTREQSKAERAGNKTEQEARLKALKKYAQGYTDQNTLAKEMSITRPELDKLLAGQEQITDLLLERIDIDLVAKQKWTTHNNF
jgi:hypothetical protein